MTPAERETNANVSLEYLLNLVTGVRKPEANGLTAGQVDRIKRFYYYAWIGDGGFDSALVAYDRRTNGAGTCRPFEPTLCKLRDSYFTYKARTAP